MNAYQLTERIGFIRTYSLSFIFTASGFETDFSGDIRRFELRLNFFTVVLLHRDILTSSDETRLPEETSVREMQTISNEFFAHFMQSNLNGKTGRQLVTSLDKNHFR